MITLEKINVKTFIEVNQLLESNHYEDEIDREIDVLSTITGKPEDYYFNMLWEDFQNHRIDLQKLSLATVSPQPKKYIKANGNVYAPIYVFNELTAGQYLDINHLISDKKELINNLPKILASICVPTKRTLTGRVKLPYLSKGFDHEEVSKDFESASITEVYAIAVFFCHVWMNLMQNIGGSLVKKILQNRKGTKLSPEEIAGLLNILDVFSDGITQRKELQK